MDPQRLRGRDPLASRRIVIPAFGASPAILRGVTMEPPPRPVPWRANLIALWVAQVGTTLGFSFTFPFYPLFFEELGGFTEERAAFWAGVAGWVFGLGMGLFSPIWGVLGDRYGRKLNVLRALGLGGLFLALSGFAETPAQLLASRFVIGATSGVVPTIMALVAAHTPRERLTFASGIIQSGLFLGIALGPLFGGLIYDEFGIRAAFIATGAALWASAVIVILLVREDFRPPQAAASFAQPFAALWRLGTSRDLLPLYGVVFLVLAANLVIQPAVPGLVERVEGGSGTGTASGVVFAGMGAASAASAVAMGWIAGRVGVQRVLALAAALAACAGLIPYFAQDYLTLGLGLAAISLFAGGLSGLVNGLIALRAPAGRHGAAFGTAQLAHAFGVALGPLVGGAAVIGWGLRSVFLLDVAAFALVLLVVAVLLGGARGARE